MIAINISILVILLCCSSVWIRSYATGLFGLLLLIFGLYGWNLEIVLGLGETMTRMEVKFRRHSNRVGTGDPQEDPSP